MYGVPVFLFQIKANCITITYWIICLSCPITYQVHQVSIFFFLKKEGDRRVREGDVTRESQRKRREILRERFQDTPVLVLKMEEGTQEQGIQAPLGSCKGKKTASLLEPTDGMQPCWYLDFRTSDFRTVRWWICAVLSH